MSFETYVQRADNFITKQMNKLEQRQRSGSNNKPTLRASGYNQIPLSSQPQPHYSHPSAYHHPASSPPLAPHGWTREYDAHSQRWYYVERSSGRSQWAPPAYAPPQPPRASTFQAMPSPHHQYTREDEERGAARPVSSGNGMRASGSGSGSLGLHTQLAPGTHLDMKTGKVVGSMFPEGQTHESWRQELQRL
ncbi:hypothetical protein BDW02DRAFT_565763 [Decorospora gaudefroyi]|uniref:WW domain-containing protein n=1 Tax=Decorospora gaudefroyi TaxID=184978 RepID=A0A6A5KNW4_9PLEO|nr:hypothetical protein BDW02DRAFT_565763 [Decorospora gaudefroyi]